MFSITWIMVPELKLRFVNYSWSIHWWLGGCSVVKTLDKRALCNDWLECLVSEKRVKEKARYCVVNRFLGYGSSSRWRKQSECVAWQPGQELANKQEVYSQHKHVFTIHLSGIVVSQAGWGEERAVGWMVGRRRACVYGAENWGQAKIEKKNTGRVSGWLDGLCWLWNQEKKKKKKKEGEGNMKRKVKGRR